MQAPKQWMKLDNAAIIYPTTLTKDYAVMFRETVKFSDDIDKEILDKALENVMPRFPSFSYKLSEGFFWFYLKKIEGLPTIEPDYKNPMYRIDFKQNNNFLFRIRYYEKRLAIEYFHALTDGYGGLAFLLTLSGEYIRLRYGEEIKYSKLVLNPKDESTSEEYEDMFKKFARRVGSSYKENKAYHYMGTNTEKHILQIITGKIDIGELKEKCKEYSCTITEFIVGIMIYVLQNIQMKKVPIQKLRKEIKVSIPINLRNTYKVNSLRNFSSYENVGINPKYGIYELPEIICEVKNQMNLALQEKRLNSKISSNINLEDNPFIKRVPLFLKKPIISSIQNNLGDNYITATFSNLGYIKLDPDMEKYIDELGFILGRAKNSSTRTSCVGYKDKLYISFSRKIVETDFEKMFFCTLVEMGIGVTVESNYGEGDE